MADNHIGIKSFKVVISRTQDRHASTSDPDSHRYDLEFSTPGAAVRFSAESAPGPLKSPQTADQGRERCYVLGDGQDINGDSGLQYLGNGVMLRCSVPERQLEISTSITGLPAAFMYRDSNMTVVASDIRSIAETPGLRLQFDPRGLTELATIGHPINHRTLFKGVSVVPAGTRLRLVNDIELVLVGSWSPDSEPPFRDWPEYIDAQIGAMTAAFRRLDLSQSFLSLTAGLDTRAIFALMIREGVRMPAYTMSGERVSLDAMRARQLCDAYGLAHNNVSIDSGFVEGLPAHAAEASRLSGGLGSLGQAFEVYFYRTIPGGLSARISGNLGNQIGRSGTEGTGMRNAGIDVLSPDLRAGAVAGSGGHWFNEIFPEQQMMHPRFLIQNENLYASLGNYCIGSHFAVQQTPYADRTVIIQKLRQPPSRNPGGRPEAIWRIKLRDLRHRLFGQPVEFSFQRRIVKDTGGFVSSCPINWGWRARGGVSLGGLWYGGMALTDALLGSRLGRHPIPTRLLSALGIHGFSGFQAVDILGIPRIRQFVADTLSSAVVRQGGILNEEELERIAGSDPSDPALRTRLEFALDVALAQQNFLGPG